MRNLNNFIGHEIGKVKAWYSISKKKKKEQENISKQLGG